MAALPALLLLGLAACDPGPDARGATLIGEPKRGAELIAQLGCGSCHSIPGVNRARGRVGPPLDNIGERTVIAGMLPNTPQNMITWLLSPQAVVPGNAMPNQVRTDADARDIAAYLYTLR